MTPIYSKKLVSDLRNRQNVKNLIGDMMADYSFKLFRSEVYYFFFQTISKIFSKIVNFPKCGRCRKFTLKPQDRHIRQNKWTIVLIQFEEQQGYRI